MKPITTIALCAVFAVAGTVTGYKLATLTARPVARQIVTEYELLVLETARISWLYGSQGKPYTDLLDALNQANTDAIASVAAKP